MDPQSSWLYLLVYAAVFVGVLLSFEGLRQVLSRGEDPTRARNRRMKMLAKGASPQEVLSVLRDDDGSGGIVAKSRAMLAQSGLPIGLPGMALMCLMLALIAVPPLMLVLPAPAAAALGAALGVTVPWAVILVARRKRLNLLVQQLPEALDLMGRGLRVGHPLNVTISSVATDMADPIGTEFGIIQDQISYGDTVVDAFSDFADRVDLEDVRYLSVSVGIQHGSGGNLANVLQVLSQVIRDRAMMKKKIVAISAEGRYSATLLTLLPFGIFGTISLTSPDYYTAVESDPMFLPIMGSILGLVTLQTAILYKLVSFRF